MKKYRNTLNIFYFFEKVQGLNNNKCYKNSSGKLIWNGISVEKENSKEYYKKVLIGNKENLIIDIDKILKKFIDKKKKNIVIISAHGGIFQSFIDLATSPATAMNTVDFCNIINKYNIELLYLDMCAMNYLEIFYEILYKGKIKKIITYKNQGPLEAINYNEILKLFEENDFNEAYKKFFYKSNQQLISCGIENLEQIEILKGLLNNLAKKCFSEKYPNFDGELKILKRLLSKIIKSNYLAEISKEPGINFIRFYLVDRVDRLVYNSYKITEENFWRFLVSDNDAEKIKEFMILSLENIEHLLWLYNPTLKKEEIEKVLINFLKIRNEEKYYKPIKLK